MCGRRQGPRRQDHGSVGDGSGAGGARADTRQDRDDSARERTVAGRRMRVDTTVVETNIHYPTDSSLLGDGVRVLTRTMKKITKIASAIGVEAYSSGVLVCRSEAIDWSSETFD